MNSVTPGIDRDSFEFIREMVLDRSAIVLDFNKGYLIETRLAPIARKHGMTGVGRLVEAMRLANSSALRSEVIEAMTTHETSFFRDLHPFDALRTTILPQLIAARGALKTLNIWCAACSSGQEPYTIAMLIREHFPLLATWNVRLTATDLSNQILDRAREGVFTQTEVNRGLPAPLLVKYFKKDGLKWRLRDDIRKMIHFSTMNLAEAWPSLPRFDVVFLRNVLIYFSTETKREILQKVARNLAPDGCLFLGGAETTLNLCDAFTRVNVGKASCYQPTKGGGAPRGRNAQPQPENVCLP